jgi:hypothetical protein
MPGRRKGDMDGWEYGYLHQVFSFDQVSAYESKETIYFVIQTAAGLRLLENLHSLLDAFNICGSEGWIVEAPSAWKLETGAVTNLISERLGIETHNGLVYFMRRTVN